MGLRIAALRRAAGWSQSQLARQLGISPSAVGMYEQGRREPSVQMLSRLSRLFGVSIDYLVTGRAETAGDARQLSQALEVCVEDARQLLRCRKEVPFSRQELTALLAALLLEEPAEGAAP